jgi:hypothetical protein
MREGDDAVPENGELLSTESDESAPAASAWLPRVSGRPAALVPEDVGERRSLKVPRPNYDRRRADVSKFQVTFKLALARGRHSGPCLSSSSSLPL